MLLERSHKSRFCPVLLSQHLLTIVICWLFPSKALLCLFGPDAAGGLVTSVISVNDYNNSLDLICTRKVWAEYQAFSGVCYSFQVSAGLFNKKAFKFINHAQSYSEL